LGGKESEVCGKIIRPLEKEEKGEVSRVGSRGCGVKQRRGYWEGM